jgi:ABC-type nickel/cobalt efflux system permease component RcnA
MIDTVVIQPGADTGEPSVAGVSWAAVAAGAIVCCAVTLVVLAFGIGLGLSVVSPWGGSGASATIFKIGTGLYLVVVAMLSSSIGGQAVSLLRVKMRNTRCEQMFSAIINRDERHV